MKEPNMTSTLIRKNRRLLVVHGIKHTPITVEAPGGKRKPGESLVACSERELREELGIEISVVADLGDYETKFPEGPFLVRMNLGRIVKGVPKVQESERCKIAGPYWRTYEELVGEWEPYLVPNLRAVLPFLRKMEYI